MREYILTEQECYIVKKFIEDGTKLDGWTTLRWRITHNKTRLQEDIDLIEKFIEKTSTI